MLVLTFQVGDERLALDIRSVVEVTPRVQMRRPMGAPDWLAGVCIYRGRAVPVLDLHRLAAAGDCPPHLSSRIILVRRPGPGQELLGLLAARVDQVRDLADDATVLDGLGVAGGPDFGPMVVDDGRMFRRVDLERLAPEPLLRLGLRAAQEAQG
jgi:chemotaxis signal transduction protein